MLSEPGLEKGSSRRWLWMGGALTLYGGVFLSYALTWSYHYDESYHLLAAQLINAGKRPYVDFCFPQAPLNAYWNAGWMRLLGPTWRVAHLIAAMLTMGAVALMVDFVRRRFPVAGWRLAGALGVGSWIGLNEYVFEYGPLGQPYGACLFLLAAAFRVSIVAVDRRRAWPAALSGLLASAAAGCSLLTAAAFPVFWLWILLRNRAGNRWVKFGVFAASAAIPWLPVLRLLIQGPRQTWFNLVQYHAKFRRLYWPDTTRHDLEVLTGWIDSGQGLILGLLAIFGLIFVVRRSGWPEERKSEFLLCGWLAAALCAEVGLAHPTFAQYFLFAVPFGAVLALAGLYAIASRVLEGDGSRWAVVLVTGLFAIGLAKSVYDDRESHTWGSYQRVADKVQQLTPPGGQVFANEPVYFLTRRIPPPGMELSYTHELPLKPADAALFHILNKAAVKKLVESERFATAFVDEEDEIKAYGLASLYEKQATVDEFKIFWKRK